MRSRHIADYGTTVYMYVCDCVSVLLLFVTCFCFLACFFFLIYLSLISTAHVARMCMFWFVCVCLSGCQKLIIS